MASGVYVDAPFMRFAASQGRGTHDDWKTMTILKRIGAGLAGIGLLAASLATAAPAMAAPGDWIESSTVTIKRADGDTSTQLKINDEVKVSANWTAPVGAVGGNQFSLELPSFFSVVSFAPFDLLSDTGEVAGSCATTSSPTLLTCTLSDYVNDKIDVHGTVEVTLKVTGPSTDGTASLKLASGETVVVPLPGGQKIEPATPGPDPVLKVVSRDDTTLEKVGRVQNEFGIRWRILVYPGNAQNGNVVLVDELSPDSPAAEFIIDPTAGYWIYPTFERVCDGFPDNGQSAEGVPEELLAREFSGDRRIATFTITPEAFDKDGRPCYVQIMYTTTHPDGLFVGDVFTNELSLGDRATSASFEIDAAGAGTGNGTERPVNFTVSKSLAGAAASSVPADTTFPIEYTANGVAATLQIPADGSVVTSPRYPAGTTFVVGEGTPPAVNNVVWSGSDIALNGTSQGTTATFTPTAGTTEALVVTNTADAATGSFQLSKIVGGAAAAAVPDGTEFIVDYSAAVNGETTTGSLTVTKGGAPVVVSGIAAGAVVTLTERAPSAVPGSAWGTPRFTSAGSDLGTPATFTVGAGTTTDVTVTNELAVTPSVSVGDRVWSDLNRDGIQDAGEPGLSNVLVSLTGPGGVPVVDINGNAVAPITTGAEGAFSFVNLPVLPAGEHYTVTVDPNSAGLAGLVPTTAGAGADRSVDSSTGSAESSDLTTGGASDTSLDFGFVPAPVPTGSVEISSSVVGDGAASVPDGTEFRVDYSFPVDGETRTGTVTVTKGGSPVVIPDVPVGVQVTLTPQPAPGVEGSTWGEPSFTVDGTPSGSPAVVTVTEGQPTVVELINTATLLPPTPRVSVGDLVWSDANRDGLRDAGEPGLSGVVLTIAGPNGAAVADIDGNPVGPQTTDADGAYRFVNLPVLPAGEHYTVTVDPNSAALAGLVPTTSGVGGDRTVDSSTGSAESTDLTADGASDTSLDFGFVPALVPTGSFQVSKSVLGDGAGSVPAGTEFRVDYSYTVEGEPRAGTVTLVAGGAPVVVSDIPAGTQVTLTEQPAPGVEGSTWGEPSFTVAGNPAGSTAVLTIAEGESTVVEVTNTATLLPPTPKVSVGDLVWSDSNRDGVRDAGEPGLFGVVLTITGPNGAAVADIDGTPVGSQTTDADGAYRFVNLPVLPAGEHYTVTVDPNSAALAGLVPTTSGVGGDRAVDSSTGSAESTDLTADGASDTTLDFGFVPAEVPVTPSVSVGDRVWSDLNVDGIQDAGDLGLPNVLVSLTGPGGAPVVDINGNPVAPVTTGGDGSYSFVNLPVLPAGQHYTVTVDSNSAGLAGLAPTTPGVGSDRALDSSTGSAESSDLTADGASDTTLDFGFVVAEVPSTPSVSVGDRVWSDTNRDGIQDAGDPGVAGVTVSVTGPNGAAVVDINGNPVGSITTGADGSFRFVNLPVLPAGEHYTVTVDPNSAGLAGLVPTTAGVGGDRAVDSSTGSAESTDLTADGASDTSLDFGFVPAPVPTGSVEISSSVVGDGAASVPDGTEFRVDYSFPVDGETRTGTVTVTKGGSPVVIPDVPVGVQVTLTPQPAPGVEGSTWGEPSFTVDGTPSGSPAVVTVTEGQPTVVELTNTATLLPPTPRVSVGDLVWSDANRDGVRDAGEPGLSGVVLTIAGPNGAAVADIDGTPVGSQTTDADGAYRFVNLPVLPAGEHYTVTVDPNSAALVGLVPTTPGVGGDRAVDSSTGSAESTDLTADGASDTTLDFGFVPASVSVGDRVWSDTNRDGIQDAGEPGLADVTVSISGPNGAPVVDINGNPVAPVTTGADGSFSFANLPVLPAGEHYTVTVDPDSAGLAGLVPTTPGVGGDRTVDSSTGSAESTDLTADGASDTTLDFGFVPASVSVGDLVWSDTDGDGIQDAGEPGLPNVVVSITGPDGAAVEDIDGNAVDPITTGDDGSFSFVNLPILPAGEHYTVTVDPNSAGLAGLVPTTAGVGEDRGADSSTGSAESSDLTVDGASDTSLDFGFVPAPVVAPPTVPQAPAADAPSTGSTSGGDGSLASTGQDGWPAITGAAGILLALGLVMLWAARRRREGADQVAGEGDTL